MKTKFEAQEYFWNSSNDSNLLTILRDFMTKKNYPCKIGVIKWEGGLDPDTYMVNVKDDYYEFETLNEIANKLMLDIRCGEEFLDYLNEVYF